MRNFAPDLRSAPRIGYAMWSAASDAVDTW